MQEQTAALAPLLNYSELSKILKRAENTLRQDVMCKRIPFVKIGHSVRFDANQIKDWLNNNKVEARS